MKPSRWWLGSVSIGVVGATVLLAVLWRTGARNAAGGRPVVQAEARMRQETSREGSGTFTPRTGPGDPTAASPGRNASSVTSPGSTLPVSLEALLSRRDLWIKRGEIPPMDEAARAELVRRYEAAEGITNRYRIARILAMAGATEAVPLLIAALTNEYRGQVISAAEQGLLFKLPELLGLLAAQDDAALQFLLRGCSLGFWENLPLWDVSGGRVSGEALRQRCLIGLAWSGRQEWRALRQELRNDKEKVLRLRAYGGLVDAVFVEDVVAAYGLDEATDRLMSGLDRGLEEFVLWSTTTTNGIAWYAWCQEMVWAQYHWDRGMPP